MAKLPKTLDIGMSNLGGRTCMYARNVKRHGDWATIALIVGDVEGSNEYLIDPFKEFDTPEYLAQMKAHINSFRPEVVFVNDNPAVNPEEVITKAEESHKLMDFEKDMIRKNPEKLHEVYCVAKPKKQDELPSQYNYEFQNGLYPIFHVFKAVTAIIHA